MRIGRQVPDPQHYLLLFHVLKISVAEPEPPRATIFMANPKAESIFGRLETRAGATL